MAGSAGNAFISNNTISNNGLNGGGQTPGVRMQGSANTISQNIISNNYGAGILAQASTINSTFTQNSIFGNGTVRTTAGGAASGQIGIDLLGGTDNANQGTGTFVTLNDNGDGDAGANGLTNMPVIQTSTVRNGVLYLTGFSRPGATLEFFIAAPNPTTPNAVGANFGQGQTYLFTRIEGAADDLLATSGSYSGNINGFNQGAETNQNLFSFAVPLSSLSAAQQATLNTGTAFLTATATQVMAVSGNQGTSEFSGNAPVFLAPVANNDFAATTPGTPFTFTGATAVTANDTPTGTLDATTVTLGTAVPTSQGVFTKAANGDVTFTPAAGFVGVATIAYTVSNTSGTVSNTAFISVTVRNPAIDLATTITAPANNATVNAGAAQTFTLRATNNSTTAVAGVMETLQLPAGLTNNGATVIITGGQNAASATYNNTTGLMSIPVGTLAASSFQTYNVAISAMPVSGPVTATANITGTGPETNLTNNTAAVTVIIAPRYDVATTITGTTTNVLRGNEVTYTVTTANLTTVGSVSPAPNVVQTVQLPANLAGVYASNGGTYDKTSGVVTFPIIDLLPVGQTVVNTISFPVPAATTSYTNPTATVKANTDNTGDIATANNAATLNGAGAGTTTTVAPTTAQANVYTTIISSAANVAPGGAITFTVTTGNAGPAAATSVVQTLQLPVGLSGVTVTNGTYNSTTGLVTFNTISTLSWNSTNPSSFTVTLNAPTQGFVLATASVSSATSDPVPADNLAQTKVEVNPIADVATTLAGPATASPGQVVTYSEQPAASAKRPPRAWYNR